VTTNDASNGLAAIIGANVRAARQAKRWTQHELAVALGSGDLMTVSRWERGEHRPNDANLIALAGVLGQTVAWFYTDHEREAA
jgi:transcriptional regulator with XRE-family HTH domain